MVRAGEEARDREREDRIMARMDEQNRLQEARLRNLENEQMRLARELEHEQSHLRDTLKQYKQVIENHTLALMGDGDQREGVLNWKNRMDRQYQVLSTKLWAAAAAIGGLLLEFVREKLTELLK
ncbi:hypothetical protein [Nitrospira sp. Nam74]